MSDNKRGCDFEIIFHPKPMKVQFLDSDGKAQEVSISINITDVEENLNKPKNSAERYSFSLQWNATKVRAVLIGLVLLFVGSTAFASAGSPGLIENLCGYDYAATPKDGSTQGCSINIMSKCHAGMTCKAVACDGTTYIVTDKSCLIGTRRSTEVRVIQGGIGGSATWAAGAGGAVGGSATLVGGVGDARGGAATVYGGAASLTLTHGGRGGNVLINPGHGDPDGQILITGDAEVNGSPIVTEATLAKLRPLSRYMYETDPFLFFCCALVISFFVVGLVALAWTAKNEWTTRRRLSRIRAWRDRQAKTAEGPYRS